MNSEHQKFDVNIEEIAINITPATIRTMVHMTKSMIKLQVMISIIVLSNIFIPL
jgi:hypothetical protein